MVNLINSTYQPINPSTHQPINLSTYQPKMKSLYPSILFCLLSMSLFAQRDSFVFENRKRTFEIHIPPTYNGSTKVPLLIAMHGGFGSGAQLETQSQLSIKADANNFIVVYPDGIGDPILNIRTWNAGGCCGYSMNNNINDVGFISALIDTMLRRYTIEAKRVYATGMSNGGFMSYRLACELSHKIAAIAPVAATMNVYACNPSRAIPIIHFHSYADSNVPFEGGIGSGVSNHYNPPVDSVLNAWAGKNTCGIRNDTMHKGTDYLSIRWTSCKCTYEEILYASFDGGHSWPGGKKTPVGDSGSVYINANDLMWDFFQKYTLDCPPTGIEGKPKPDYGINIFPNPGFEIVSIEIPPSSAKGTLMVTDHFGKIIKTVVLIGNSTLDLDITGLNRGFYFIYLKDTTRQIIGKFVKN